jgi:hypothetical protein
VAVEPVKVTRSTRGSVESISPSPWSDEATMLSTPGGKSVCCASLPRCVALHGVSGAGLSTTVHPDASAGPIFAMLR